MFARVVVNRPHPFRLQLILVGLMGPLASPSLGAFDPRRDVTIYNGGSPMGVSSYTYDPARNRYLVFLQAPLDFDRPIQVIHHVPSPPFAEEEGNAVLSEVAPGHDPDLLVNPAVII